jgi:hypothetical protein
MDRVVLVHGMPFFTIPLPAPLSKLTAELQFVLV